MSSKTFPSTGDKPTFNPNAHYEAIEQGPIPKGNKPAFNPNDKYEKVSGGATEQESSSVFKPITDWLNIQQGYQPLDKSNAVQLDAHTVKTGQAAGRVKEQLIDMDNSIGNLIHDRKKDLQGRFVSEQLGLNPKETGPINPQAQQLSSQLRQDIPVDQSEINGFKAAMDHDHLLMRQGLAQKAKDLMNSDPIKAKQLKSDIYRLDRQNDPEKDSKIDENINKINDGEYDYDIANGVLTRPVGFFSGIVEGFKQKNKAFDEYGFYSTGKEDEIIKHLNKKITGNPDEPTVVGSDGYANIVPGGEGGMMLGGQPIKPLAGGALAGWLGGPQAGTAAMSLISGPEMYKLGYANALPQNYAEIKKQNPDITDADAYHKASELADKQASVDAATGIAMGALGGEFAFKPTGLGANLLKKSVGSALKQVGEEGAKKALEGLGVGAIGGAGQVVKNIMAQKAGFKTETAEGVPEQLKTGAYMTLGMTLAAKLPKLLNPKTYNQLFQAISNQPKEAIDAQLKSLEQSGHITSEESQGVQDAIQDHQALDQSIKSEVPQADRIKVQELIKKRNALEASLETEDKAYHADTKEKIKALNEQINGISKGADRGELQALVDQEHKAGNIEGFVTETLRDASEGDLKQYFKEIAEQAQDPNSEAATIETFGENIVNKAKELFPASDLEQHKSFQEAGLLAKKSGDGKVLGTWLLKNGETGDTLTLNDGSGYEITSSKEGEVILTPFEIDENGNRDYNHQGIRIITENQLKHGDLFESGYTNNNGEREIEQYKYNKANKEIDVNSLFDDTKSTAAPENSKISIIQPGEIKRPETITIKPKDNAIPIGSTETVHVGETPGDSQTMGGGIPESGEAASPQEAGVHQEEGVDTSQEGVADLKIDEVYGLPFIEEPGDKITGIKNSISNATRFERKLPPVEVTKLGSDQEVLLEGKRLVDDGVINPIDVVNRILDTKEGMQPDEAKAMQYYMHQLAQQDTSLRERLAGATSESDRAEINGLLRQLSDEIDAATQANIISGRAWSDVGNIRQVVSDTGFNASRDVATIKDAYGGKIPKDVQAKLDNALKERNDALNRLAKLQAEEKNRLADDAVKKRGAPKNAKKTSIEFKEERNQIKKDILDKLKKGRSGEGGLTAVPLPFAKELISIAPDIFRLIKSYAEEGVQKTEEVINRLHDVLKDEIDGITKADIVNLLAGRYKESEGTVSPIAQRLRDFRTEANLWSKIAEATKMEEDTPQKKQEKNKKLQDLRDRLNDIRKRNNEAISEMKDILATDAQKEMKKLQQRRKGLESRYKNKKYLLPPEKRNAPINTEILKEKQRIINANYKIRIEKRRSFESQKSFYQKSLMWVGRGVRLSVLSGYNVLAKLAAASTIGGAAKRIPEQMIGLIYGHAFKGISEKAPIEGFVNAGAEAKFYKEFFNPKKFVKNTWEILKSGESPLSKKFSPGTYEHIPGIYLPTDLHQVIKDPLKRGVYEASLKNALIWAERNGLDINDDLVIQSIETAAYKRAQYEIFQEQNWLSKKFGEWKHNMDESGNLGSTGKFLADFMIPVSTVPTNIARRIVSTSPFGLIKGGVEVVSAYRKGIESLSPEEADSVMRQLKQGTLGTALWLIGWYGYSQFGGLYSKFNPNKQRDEGDLVSDEMSVGGKMVPKPVQHALPLEIIQFASTARRVYDNYKENKNASTQEAIEKAGLASIGALTEQIPVVETVAHTIGAFNNPYEAKKLEEDVKRRFQPQILKETGIIGKEESNNGAGATGAVKHKTTKHIKSHSHKNH